jgi:hypothetical protein
MNEPYGGFRGSVQVDLVLPSVSQRDTHYIAGFTAAMTPEHPLFKLANGEVLSIRSRREDVLDLQPN